MSIPADTLERLAALDLPADKLQAVITIILDSHKRSKNAERQARFRAKKRNESVTNNVSNPSPPPSLAPPRDINSTPPRSPLTLPLASSLCSDVSASPVPIASDLFGLEEKIKIPKAKAARQAAIDELRAFGEIWNEGAGRFKIAQVDFIDPGSLRERRALAALKLIREKYEIGVVEFLAKVWASPLLRGEAREWSATFDWICNLTNLGKIMENTYAPRPKVNGNGHANGHYGR